MSSPALDGQSPLPQIQPLSPIDMREQPSPNEMLSTSPHSNPSPMQRPLHLMRSFSRSGRRTPSDVTVETSASTSGTSSPPLRSSRSTPRLASASNSSIGGTLSRIRSRNTSNKSVLSSARGSPSLVRDSPDSTHASPHTDELARISPEHPDMLSPVWRKEEGWRMPAWPPSEKTPLVAEDTTWTAAPEESASGGLGLMMGNEESTRTRAWKLRKSRPLPELPHERRMAEQSRRTSSNMWRLFQRGDARHSQQLSPATSPQPPTSLGVSPEVSPAVSVFPADLPEMPNPYPAEQGHSAPAGPLSSSQSSADLLPRISRSLSRISPSDWRRPTEAAPLATAAPAPVRPPLLTVGTAAAVAPSLSSALSDGSSSMRSASPVAPSMLSASSAVPSPRAASPAPLSQASSPTVPSSLAASPVAPSTLSAQSKRETQRQRLLREMADTERSYAADLGVVKNLYLARARMRIGLRPSHTGAASIFTTLPTSDGGSGAMAPDSTQSRATDAPLSAADIQVIFAGVEECAALADDMAMRLAEAADGTRHVSGVFLSHCAKIEQVYALYCSRHEASMARLADVMQRSRSAAAFLRDCDATSRQHSHAWDLPSLLIKPVQRVLKYPLFLRSVLENTEVSDSEYPALQRALAAMTDVADHINEYKKRIDMVEQHGFGLPTPPRAHAFRLSRARAPPVPEAAPPLTADEMQLRALVARLNDEEAHMERFAKQCVAWMDALRNMYRVEIRTLREWEAVYACAEMADRGAARARVVAFRALIEHGLLGVCARIDRDLQTHVAGPIRAVRAVLERPRRVLLNRAAKESDYRRFLQDAGRKPGRKPDTGAAAFLSLHTQLIAELPSVLRGMHLIMSRCVFQFVRLQTAFHASVSTELRQFAEEYAPSLMTPTSAGSGPMPSPVPERAAAPGGAPAPAAPLSTRTRSTPPRSARYTIHGSPDATMFGTPQFAALTTTDDTPHASLHKTTGSEDETPRLHAHNATGLAPPIFAPLAPLSLTPPNDGSWYRAGEKLRPPSPTPAGSTPKAGSLWLPGMGDAPPPTKSLANWSPPPSYMRPARASTLSTQSAFYDARDLSDVTNVSDSGEIRM